MIREIQSRPDSIFLTFDDGPDGAFTEAVLDVLKEKGALATFFLIANKIPGQELVVSRMIREGHAIGNHSFDHRYRNYFRGPKAMREWIARADAEFARLGLPESVGFRPPAGIVTPVVKRVVREMNEPMVLWNERFYDTVHAWTRAKAERSAKLLKGGSVVLLHDRVARQKDFGSNLEFYIDQLHGRGFKLEPLSRGLTQR